MANCGIKIKHPILLTLTNTRWVYWLSHYCCYKNWARFQQQ